MSVSIRPGIYFPKVPGADLGNAVFQLLLGPIAGSVKIIFEINGECRKRIGKKY